MWIAVRIDQREHFCIVLERAPLEVPGIAGIELDEAEQHLVVARAADVVIGFDRHRRAAAPNLKPWPRWIGDESGPRANHARGRLIALTMSDRAEDVRVRLELESRQPLRIDVGECLREG